MDQTYPNQKEMEEEKEDGKKRKRITIRYVSSKYILSAKAWGAIAAVSCGLSAEAPRKIP